MRYDRDEYRMDWRATKSDILRSKRAVAQRRKLRVTQVLGVILALIALAISVEGMLKAMGVI